MYLRYAALFIFVLLVGITVFPPSFFDVESDNVSSTADTPYETIASTEVLEVVPVNVPTVQHQPLPKQVKAIYMTACVAGTPDFRQRLVQLIQETEINAVMIDIKDFSGTIAFPPESDAWKPAWFAGECGAHDMRELIAMLHDNDIFVIGRITVFQDPFYAPKNPELAVQRSDRETVWTDHKGLSFIDVASRPYWDHLVELSKESYNLGFDELNFDYVRYPSDGNMQDIYFPQTMQGEFGLDRQANLETFFVYLYEQLSDPELFADYEHQNTGRETSIPYTSADLFGMTTSNYDDLTIGQVQERAAPYFDFIAPMVYPSHYTEGFLGRNPNDYPYDVVYKAMKNGVDRMQAETTPVAGFAHTRIGTSTPAVYQKPVYDASKFRTWIQDFDYGGDYDAFDVRAQIQASYDAGVTSWMIWSPSNIYTRGALLPADYVE